MDNPESIVVQFQDDVDLNSVCRLCFSTEGELVPVSAQLRPAESTENLDHTSLSDLIDACIQLKFSKDDESPQNICYNCINYVVGWSEFKKKSHETDGLIRNWQSQLKNVQSDQVKVKIESDEIEGTTPQKVSDGPSDSEDYWILVVGDGAGAGEKLVPASSCTNVSSTSSSKVSNKTLERGHKPQLQNKNVSKIGGVNSNLKSAKDVDRIKRLIEEKRYKLKNGCIVINSSDLESVPEQVSDGEVRSASDLFSNTSFSIDDDLTPTAVPKKVLIRAVSATPNTVVDKIQQLIDDNDTILKTSEVNVKHAHAVLKTAETQLNSKSTKSNDDSFDSILSSVPPSILRRRGFLPTHGRHVQETRKRKRSKGSLASKLEQNITVSCDICGVKFYNCESLLVHDRTKHLDYPRLFCCQLCNECFLTGDHLNLHASAVHKIDTANSSEEEEAPQKKIILRFKSSDPSKDPSELGPRTLICGICDETFRSMTKLKTHLESCENSVLFV